MRKKRNVWISWFLCVLLLIAVVPLSVSASEPEYTYYLSDYDWVSATHGDATSSKQVQKNRPFTPGNEGQNTSISLLMPDGSTRVYEKGLGTVAGYPSSIVYNISGAGAVSFHTYAGLDRSSGHQNDNYANVEKIEILIDDQIVYSTLEQYPEGVKYNTPAIEISLSVPAGAKRLELRSYAGQYTWGDEVVFADARVIATGIMPNPDDWNAPQLSTRYLSDYDWVSATHGDATVGKTVQKNQPFTPGNEGYNTPISLLMSDGSTRVFEKGLGTVAGYPSSIVYNISGFGAVSFHTFVGLDRSSGHQNDNYANVERIEILIDNQIVYTTMDQYPNGVKYNTPAVEISLDIPAGAENLELKSYAGQYTWGDEVVFADAAVMASSALGGSQAEETDTWYDLSELRWVSATHGDAMSSKTVQKNHPFTPGNEGRNTPISLLMSDGVIREFESGLGTVAGYPSAIRYSIQDAGVSRFHAYMGLDRSAGHQDTNYANVEKIEIVVDTAVLYDSSDDYPNGIHYDTPAIEVDLDVPEDASWFELRCYAGAKTWGDEVVYADAAFLASGTLDGSSETVPSVRREISNEHPMLMIPLYANGQKYQQAAREYVFWGDDTLSGKWESVPADLKPYTVIQIHPDDLPQNSTSAADFYEHCLMEAQNHINPITGEKEPIPIVLTVYTAGNRSYYTALHWLSTDWIDRMYQQYSCLQGIFSTENYWVWTGGLENMAAEYLRISARHGGYFIWAEQNNGASIEKAMGTQGQNAFRMALEEHWENFIFMYKNTPAAEGNDAPTASYMEGLWLTDYAYQWGGLMDTWKWYETGKWRLFESGSIGKSQGNRQWLTEPEAMLGMEALTIYLNGGCVYNFEHPFYTYGVKDTPSALFSNVLVPFMRYAVENPAPSKEEMRAKTMAIIRGNFSAMGNGNFFAGWNTEIAQSPLYTTGRYGVIPAVPTTISADTIHDRLQGYSIEVVEQGDARIASTQARRTYFNGLYPEEYTGTAFAQRLDSRWFVYNSKVNENVVQRVTDLQTYVTSGNGTWILDALLEPHTYLITQDITDGIRVFVNNYRTDKDSLWEGATGTAQAKGLRQISKPEAAQWVYENMILHPADQKMRTTTIEINNTDRAPVLRNVSGLQDHYEVEVTYDASNRVAVVEITSNGYVEFDIRK